MGTLRWDTPGKVEVRAHVKEGEHEAEEEGFEDYGAYEGGEGYGDAAMLEGDQNKGKTLPPPYHDSAV